LRAVDFIQAADLAPINFIQYCYFHFDWYHTYGSVKHYFFQDSNFNSCLEFVVVSNLKEHFFLVKNCEDLVRYDVPVSLELLKQLLTEQFAETSL
jgi:hypothetical protein